MAFNGRFTASLIRFAMEQGADGRDLLGMVGLSMDELTEEDRKIENEVFNSLVERILEVTGDPCFGLHAAEYLNLSAAGLILQIRQSADTVGKGMQYACDFANLGCPRMPLSLEAEGDTVGVMYDPDPMWLMESPNAVRHTVEGAMAFSLREFHALTAQQCRPVEVRFAFPAPADRSEYERIFACPIRFGAPRSALVLRRADMELPVVTRDSLLLQVLVQHAEQKLAAMQHDLGFAPTVRRAVLNLCDPHFPTLEATAANLHLSARSLQRRLRAEGLAYRDIIDELRREFALAYLKKPELNVSEIAYMLDYADPGGFVRSFKRWMGETPKRFRERFAL